MLSRRRVPAVGCSSGSAARLVAICALLMAAVCMQLGLATSLLKYKPDMHESWVDPKVRQLQSRPVIRMRSSGLQSLGA